MTIDDIGQKVENGGVSASGKLSAEEFNTLLEQVKANRDQLSGLSEKFGAVTYENGALNFYDVPGGVVLATVQLVGDAYTIKVTPSVETIFSVLTGDTSTPVTISASTEKFERVGAEGEAFPENYTYTVEINTGTGYITKIAGASLAEAGTSTFDVRSWLVTGANRIRISVTGATSGATATIVLTATLTNLTLTVDHAWQRVWAETQTYNITGIRFAGNLVKTLHIKVGDAEPVTQMFQANQNYTTTSFIYTLPSSLFPASGTSGVHTIEIWVSGGGVETQHVKYNIMCMLENDTASLVCVNNIAASAINYMGERLFSFAVANADSVLLQPVVTLEGTHSLPQLSMSVEEGQTYDYAPALELEVVSETTIGSMTVTATPYDMGSAGADVQVTLPFDNSLAFNATAGSIFYLNAALRSNSEIDKDVVKNAAANPEAAEYAATWTGFGWSTDGWTADEYGHSALVIPARSTLGIPQLKPFELLTEQDNTGMTLEMLVRSANIADEQTPVLSFLTERTVAGTVRKEGFVLYPTKVVVFSTTSTSETLQGVGLCENVITHIGVVIQKSYNGLQGKNLVSIYINGIPNVAFSFDSGDTFGSASFTAGQSATDFYLYMMRVYDFPLEGQAMFNNFLNAIFEGTQISRGEYDRESTRDANDILGAAGIDYQLAVQLGYNCMVIEPDDPEAPIPDFYHQYKDSSMPCSVRFEYGQHHEWDVKITNVPLDGQGTTSKRYYRWNLRGKLKKCNWYYTDGSGTRRGNYSETPTFTDSKTGYMDGGPNGGVHLLIDRFTAKKNIASSQQGHKMGATALYDELFTQIGLKAELPNQDYRVAVWQYPFLGFRKLKDQEVYEYIGLYTAGPDKGCKETFGYNKKIYPAAMCIEGPNHNPRGTRFLHPWVDVDYDQDQETLTFGGDEAWDCDFCPYETAYDEDLTPEENAQNKADVLALYTSEWKPAYELVFHCSPYIASLAEMAASNPSHTTIAAVNADITNFLNGSTTYTDWNGESKTRSNNLMSFYDTNGDIWFYRTKTGQFENLTTVEGSNAHNIKNYLGLTGTLTTQTVIAARKAKFDVTWGNYFSKQQTFYHKDYCMLIGAKDNDAKNSYPFKHIALSAGGRWGWKQDDLDSIFNTDNNGQATVKYSVEAQDTNQGAPVFQGSNSAFWTIIWEWYADDLKTMMGTMMNGLAAIASNIGVSGSLHLHERVYAVLAHYFFDQSALYFPILAYQHDRDFGYIDPWWLGGQTIDGTTYDTQYNAVEPLTQALGDRYQDERLWLERRIAYLFSKYSLGGFAGSMDGYNSASFTLAAAYTLRPIPAIDLYPAVNFGGGTPTRASRTAAGTQAEVPMGADGQTTNYVNGTDWLASLGDLHDMPLTTRGSGDALTFTVASARMRELIVGSATEAVLFNATSLVVSGPSFEVIDARNVTTLASAVDLRNCPRLREALFEGSTALGINLAEGSRVEVVSFPNSQTTLFMHSLNELTEANMTMPSIMFPTVQSFYFNRCENINPLPILTNIVNASYDGRRYVTVIWDGTAEASAEDVAALMALAESVDTENPSSGSYGRVAYQNGQTSNVASLIPLIQGNIHPAGITQQQYDKITATFPDIAFIGSYKLYLAFEDPRVWEICAYNWGDVEDARGKVIASGELEGNGDADVMDDFVFAPGLVIAAKTEDGVSIPQKAARTVDYRLEIEVEGGSGTPWGMDTTGDNVFLKVTQHPSDTTTTTTTHISATPNNYVSVLTQEGNKWVATFQATNAAQYLRVAIRAAAGVKLKWSLTPLATGNAAWQPVGITQAQCAAVSSLGTQFQYNRIITAFAELKLFAKIKSFSSYHFRQCFNLSKVKLPAGTTNVGNSFDRCDSIGTWNFYPDSLTTFNTCYDIYIDTMIVPPNVTSVAARAWSGSASKRVAMRWMAFEGDTPPTFAGNPFYLDYSSVKIFVPDGSVEAYKAVSQLSDVKSRIYPISEFEDYFPGESYERVP